MHKIIYLTTEKKLNKFSIKNLYFSKFACNINEKVIKTRDLIFILS